MDKVKDEESTNNEYEYDKVNSNIFGFLFSWEKPFGLPLNKSMQIMRNACEK